MTRQYAEGQERVEIDVKKMGSAAEIGPATDAAWVQDPRTGVQSLLIVSQGGAAWINPATGERRIVRADPVTTIPRISKAFTIVQPAPGASPIALQTPTFGDHAISAYDPSTGHVLWTYAPSGRGMISSATPVRGRDGTCTVFIQRELEDAAEQISMDGTLIRHYADWGNGDGDAAGTLDLGPRGTAVLSADRGWLVLREPDGNELWRGRPDNSARFVQFAEPLMPAADAARVSTWITTNALGDDTSRYVLELREREGAITGTFTEVTREQSFRLLSENAIPMKVGTETLFLTKSGAGMPGSEFEVKLEVQDKDGWILASRTLKSESTLYLANGALVSDPSMPEIAWLAWGIDLFEIRLAIRKPETEAVDDVGDEPGSRE